MYFINKKPKNATSKLTIHVLPAAMVLVTLLGITLLAWNNAKLSLNSEKKTTSANIANDTSNQIREQLTNYELVLTAAAGLFTSSDDVTRAEWSEFIESFHLDNKYPGIQGVGFAKQVQKDALPELIASLEREGLEKAHVFPETSRSEVVVNYLYHPRNDKNIGYDLSSELVRREALVYAKNTGTSALSGKISFVFNQDQVGAQGISLYLPVYADKNQLDHPPSERALLGFVFAPIDTAKFFDSIFAGIRSQTTNTYHLKIFDQQGDMSSPLYKSPNELTTRTSQQYNQKTELAFAGRTWSMEFTFTPDIVAKTTRERPLNTLIAGLILSPVLALFVLLLIATRTRSLTNAQQAEVNTVKDELLSLASHQLRTPATSVKQYIGMLKEGFAGTLTAQQLELLNRAYDSNERQLHIINELLYVAKLDANGLVLTPRRIDLNKLIRTQARDLGATAKKSDQRIRVYLPKKPVFVEADEHCIAMAVENLISNALKYSYEGTTTTVRLISRKQHVEIIVTDHGVGIADDDIPLLFQRFSRIPNSFSRQISGSGIGLYLSQQLVNLHGGSITVASVKDKGTSFTILLPKKYIT